MNPRQRFGSFLRHARIAEGLTQAEVAAYLGYTCAQFISNWERGISTPPIETAPVLAKLYRIPRAAFLEAWAQYRTGQLREYRVRLRRVFDEAATC